MNPLKKFWIALVAFFPFSAGAVVPFLATIVIGGAGLVGYSIYRSASPVNMQDAVNFFSTCWTCQLFSDLFATMSNILPNVYKAIGSVIIPFSIVLMAVWFAWTLFSGFLNAKIEEPWSITSTFSNRLIKLAFVIGLLSVPLPRMISQIAIEPMFSVGLSLNRTITGDIDYEKCLIATAIEDPNSGDAMAAERGAFSPKLRHGLTCEIANIHKLTGVGMAVGWTMLNMAFNYDYMHKFLWGIPIFPNIPIFFAGALIVVLFFFVLLPVPLYFVETFVKLSMDLIMLPLMLLSWVFSDWKIFPKAGGKNIQEIINDAVKSALGIAMVCVFITFSIMFINAVFGSWGELNVLQQAIERNDSKFLMDALVLQNHGIVVVLLMGLFTAMFMTMIPNLVKALFANVSIPEDFYKKAKADLRNVWGNLKKFYENIKK